MAVPTHRDKAEQLLNKLSGDHESQETRAVAHATLALVEVLAPFAALMETLAYPETAIASGGGVERNGPIERITWALEAIANQR